MSGLSEGEVERLVGLANIPTSQRTPEDDAFIKSLPEMTPAERVAQMKSFAWGNTNLSNSDITRGSIDEAYDRLVESGYDFFRVGGPGYDPSS